MPKPDQTAYDPFTPAPGAARILGMRDAFALWFSLGVGLLVLQTGALLTPGLGLGPALAVTAVATAAGVLLLGLAAVVGADTGLSAMATLRPALGTAGAAIPALLNVIQLVGWGAFEIVAMRGAADAFMKQTFGVSNLAALTVAFGAAATLLAFVGPLSFVRRFLRQWGVWLLLAGAVWLTWRLVSEADLAALMARPGTGELSLSAGFDIVIAMPLSWLPLIADYSRFGRTPGKMFTGSALGYFLANVWFFGLGACFALLAPGKDPIVAALAMAGGGLAILLILIDETDNAFADIFSAAMSTASVAPLNVRLLAVGFGVLCTAIALFVQLDRYLDFLLMIGSVFAPLFGVLLTDHFVLRRRRPGLAAGKRSWVWQGLLAWVGGVGAYHAMKANMPDLAATLPAFAISAVAYFVLKRGRA
jgi:NCS1 family nucleobase:cation symporter-1